LDFIIHFILNASPFFVYILVVLVLLLESSAVPIANTTLLLLTGALASLGHLNIYVLAVAAIAGSITGACLAYLLGIKGGRQVLLRLAMRFRVDPQKVIIAENWFQGAGVWMVFLSRIIPYIRPFASLPCGISRMPFRRFLFAALSGSIVWCIGILSIGWVLGPRCLLALHLVQSYTVPAICGLILLIAITVLIQYRVNRFIRSKFSSAAVSQEVEEQPDSCDLIEI
jgi:membrane protein DedA with SNARE-associated domain